jgi:hypothetical protein
MRNATMYAVPVDALNAIIFSPNAPPKGYEEYHGNVQEGVSLSDYSPEIYDWPEGSERPDVILARSRANSKQYKIFKYLRDFNNEQISYINIGKVFCIVNTPKQLVDLIKSAIRDKHRGEWIGWSEDGKRLLASGKTPEEVNAAVAKQRVGPAIFEWVEPPSETDR